MFEFKLGLDQIFLGFSFWKIWYLKDMFWYQQGDGGSLLTAIFMTIAERGTKCQSFQKGFSRFWLKICGICEPTNEREKSLACLCFSEQGGGRQSQICVKFKTKELWKKKLGNLLFRQLWQFLLPLLPAWVSPAAWTEKKCPAAKNGSGASCVIIGGSSLLFLFLFP